MRSRRRDDEKSDDKSDMLDVQTEEEDDESSQIGFVRFSWMRTSEDERVDRSMGEPPQSFAADIVEVET